MAISQKHKSTKAGGLRCLPLVAAAAIVAATVTTSCGEERKSYVPNVGSGEETPTMSTTNVSTFISDSGYVRYHITTDIWDMYEDAKDPFWKFPTGLHLKQYDRKHKPDADMVCDSALYFSRRRIWQLDGNVVMVNTNRDSFLTQQVFWDQATRKVYSDSFIHIVRSDRIIEGYGFESNEQMTEFVVHRPTGIIPVDRNKDKAAESGDENVDTTYMPSGRRTAPMRASERAAMLQQMREDRENEHHSMPMQQMR